jgi:hypothetical protein
MPIQKIASDIHALKRPLRQFISMLALEQRLGRLANTLPS